MTPSFQGESAAGATPEQISAALVTAHEAEVCVALAIAAEQIGARDLHRQCLERAVAMDRNRHDALLTLAALAMDAGDPALTFALIEETARAGLLPADVEPLRQQ